MKKINVLSLFDGIRCGMVALERAGIEVENYYASEIDRYAIQIADKNYPNCINLGDINNWRSWDIDWGSIDLLIGGSPCQGFSSSGKMLNFNDERSKLFFAYVDILNHIKKINPNIKFLLENVKIKKEWSDIISNFLDVGYVEINSKYFSAQNRIRFYWANFPIFIYEDNGKQLCEITIGNYPHSAAKRTRPIVNDGYRKSLCLEVNDSGKSLCLVTVNLNNLLTTLPKGRYIDVASNNYPYRVMYPIEMERLQTLPDGYTSETNSNKAAKVLGNCWTVDVIAHILKGLK